MKTIKLFIGLFLITFVMNAQGYKFRVEQETSGNYGVWDVGHSGYFTVGTNRTSNHWYGLQVHNDNYGVTGMLIGNRQTKTTIGVQSWNNQMVTGANRGDLCFVTTFGDSQFDNKSNMFIYLTGNYPNGNSGERFIALGTKSKAKTFRVFDNEKVVIGNNYNFDTDGDYLLYVGKGIKTERVKVHIASENGWADYVFADDYQLRTLDKVEEYIEENKHLPEVPSTDEVLKEGVELKEMTVLLLKKVEELTLYTIEQEKKINEMKKELEELKSTK
ncbi:hypothetical protein [Aureivirga marina]|uniref:hypothetical protein n=1 Tax=Aureivirga marina TaxID=1182451 RepID=UPI0018CA8780|nr:hypothetical protein [Aureivirga marina]